MRLLYILFSLILLLTFISSSVSADKVADEYANMVGVKIVTDNNVDVTYTGKTWKDAEGNNKYEYIAKISQAPIYNDDGTLVDCSWHGSEDAYVIINNVFSAQVIGSYITVTYQSKSMSWNPVVVVDSKEYVAKASPKVLAVDPVNENYKGNTLEWDYGMCVRRVRVIEGLIQETWTFSQDPKGNVWIRDNAQKQAGFDWVIAPYAYDADGNSLAVNEYKQVSASVMAGAKYPVTIDPTEVFVTSASDGEIEKSNAVYNTAWISTTGTVDSSGQYFLMGQEKATNSFIWRGYLYFDTSSLPDSANISSCNVSLYRNYDYDDTYFNVTIQSGMPTYPHDPLVTGDFDKSLYSGDGGSKNSSTLVTGYNNISLNATGMAWVSLVGDTKFCIRSSRDIAGTSPTAKEYVGFYTYEKGAGYRPTLYVTYVSSGPPDVTTNAASYVTKTTTKLNGYLDSDGGEATTVWFNYWEWYDQNWSDCIEFSINASYVDSDLTNFPVLITGAQVNQSNPNFWTTVDVNGSDILFTDENGVKLNRELVSIDTTAKTLECYVNVTSIDDMVDTKFYMYYGANVSTYNDSNSTDTWNTDYMAVYHMNDLNTSAISDSTVNGYTGIKTGANQPLEIDGNFNGDEAQYFDGINQRITLPFDLTRNTTVDLIFAYWNISETGYPFTNENDGARNYFTLLVQTAKVNGGWRYDDVGTNRRLTGTSIIVNESWYYFGTVATEDDRRLYLNDHLETSSSTYYPIAQVNPMGSPTFIGTDIANSGPCANISEVRVSSTNRSVSYIEATYYSLLEPEDFCPVTDVFHETATQSKNTGDSFYSSLSGLTPNTLYGFRAMADQTQGTDYGAWLFFDTSVTLEEPTNVTCKPDSNSITLSWVRGGNTSSTYIRYKTGGYPTGTADGNAIPLQSGVDYVHTGLTSGVTYYYKMWGEDAGTYSATNSTTACTTNAGFATASPVPLPTIDTSDWSETPNGSVLTNNPLYALGNLEADEVGVPHDTWWMLLALGGLVCTGLFIYTRSRNLLAALGAMIIFGVIMAQAGLFPIWTMIIFGLTGIGIGWKEIR